jgi:hypothetical protein
MNEPVVELARRGDERALELLLTSFTARMINYLYRVEPWSQYADRQAAWSEAKTSLLERPASLVEKLQISVEVAERLCRKVARNKLLDLLRRIGAEARMKQAVRTRVPPTPPQAPPDTLEEREADWRRRVMKSVLAGEAWRPGGPLPSTETVKRRHAARRKALNPEECGFYMAVAKRLGKRLSAGDRWTAWLIVRPPPRPLSDAERQARHRLREKLEDAAKRADAALERLARERGRR